MNGSNDLWTAVQPTAPGLYRHRNLANAQGRAPIGERLMFVGYVNWVQDKKMGHGTKPMPLSAHRLRAVRAEHPLHADCLTVQEWGGEWASTQDQKEQ